MIKEKYIWLLAKEIINTHGDIIDHLHLIEHCSDGFRSHIKIYHGDGYCFELEKQEHCSPSDYDEYKSDIVDLQKDGCTYHFGEPWDEFRVAGIKQAISFLSEYARLEEIDKKSSVPSYGNLPFSCFYGHSSNHQKRCVSQCSDCEKKQSESISEIHQSAIIECVDFDDLEPGDHVLIPTIGICEILIDKLTFWRFRVEEVSPDGTITGREVNGSQRVLHGDEFNRFIKLKIKS